VVVAFGVGILREVLNRTLLEVLCEYVLSAQLRQYVARARLRSKTKQQYDIMKSKFFESLFKVIHCMLTFSFGLTQVRYLLLRMGMLPFTARRMDVEDQHDVAGAASLHEVSSCVPFFC
jgi:hypothetical protein